MNFKQTDMSSQFSDLVRSRMERGAFDTQQRNDEIDETYTEEDGENSESSSRRSSMCSGITSLHENGPELLLTKSMGGTLGAAAVSGTYAESVISDTSEFFFMTKKKPTLDTHSYDDDRKDYNSNENDGNLGARAASSDEQEQFKERSSYESVTLRAGLYDVFAPAGPIGIVVDTTKHGPSVHSLKPTSPMLGLINPGDLIVGLDDVDTRSMTAASLTRLMARKANQRERKITLLAAENY